MIEEQHLYISIDEWTSFGWKNSNGKWSIKSRSCYSSFMAWSISSRIITIVKGYEWSIITSKLCITMFLDFNFINAFAIYFTRYILYFTYTHNIAFNSILRSLNYNSFIYLITVTISHISRSRIQQFLHIYLCLIFENT